MQQAITSDPVFASKYNFPIVNPTDPPPAFPYNPALQRSKIASKDPQAILDAARGMASIQEIASGTYHSWSELAFIREHWSGPIVLKGIQSVQDAELAVTTYGAYVDGIIVSNHGGRQIDGAIASLDALNSICKSDLVKGAQLQNRICVLFDSGIRTGSDIIKAMALGARAVLRKSSIYTCSHTFITSNRCLQWVGRMYMDSPSQVKRVSNKLSNRL